MYGSIIKKYAEKYGLKEDIIAAIIHQESKGDTYAWRWEEKFYEKFLKDKTRRTLAGFVPALGTLPSLADELLQRSCSFGLMQVLGDTARWCAKVKDPFLVVLTDPDRGIEAGCRVLQFYVGRNQGEYNGALKDYNGSIEYVDAIYKILRNGDYKKYLEYK